MKLAIYSDLHISNKELNDDFQINEEKLIDYLRSKCINGYQVILNGDVFETWESGDWKAYVNQFYKIQNRRPTFCKFLIEYITRGDIVCISGNHDAVVRIKNLIPNIKTNYTFESKGLKVYIEHGHKGDVFNHGKEKGIGQFITFCIGWLERIGLMNIDNNLSRIEKLFPSTDLDKYSKEVREKTNADIVVFGHTHIPLIKENGNWKYVNTGRCCGRKNTIDEVIIDNDEDVLQVLLNKIKL